MSAQPQTMSTRASIMLAGQQHTGIDVHGARENGARLILGWATLMLTFTAADQVHTLLDAYTDARPAAARLPVEVNPAILSATIGDEAYLYPRSPSPTATPPTAPPPCTPPGRTDPGDGHTSAGSCTSTPGSCCSASSTRWPGRAWSTCSPTPPRSPTSPCRPPRGRRCGPEPQREGCRVVPTPPAVHSPKHQRLQRAAGAAG